MRRWRFRWGSFQLRARRSLVVTGCWRCARCTAMGSCWSVAVGVASGGFARRCLCVVIRVGRSSLRMGARSCSRGRRSGWSGPMGSVRTAGSVSPGLRRFVGTGRLSRSPPGQSCSRTGSTVFARRRCSSLGVLSSTASRTRSGRCGERSRSRPADGCGSAGRASCGRSSGAVPHLGLVTVRGSRSCDAGGSPFGACLAGRLGAWSVEPLRRSRQTVDRSLSSAAGTALR